MAVAWYPEATKTSSAAPSSCSRRAGRDRRVPRAVSAEGAAAALVIPGRVPAGTRAGSGRFAPTPPPSRAPAVRGAPVSLPPLVEPAAELTVDEVRRFSRHIIIPDVG